MWKTFFSGPARAIVGLSLALACVSNEWARVQAMEPFRVVAATGEPSGVGDSSFDSFFGVFDEEGRVVVSALVVDMNDNYTSGVWFEENVGLSPSLVSGQQAPGYPTGVDLRAQVELAPTLPGGYATVTTQVFGGSLTTIQDAVYAWRPEGEWRLATYEGQAAINLPGVTVASVGALSTSIVLSNSSGSVAVEGEVFGLGTNLLDATPATWVDRGFGPEVAFHVGMQAPGYPGGAVITGLSRTGIDGSDRVAVLGSAADNTGSRDSIWLFDPNVGRGGGPDRHLLASVGNKVDGYTIQHLSDLQMAGGVVASLAVLEDDQGQQSQAILTDLATTPRILARQGDPAPGATPDAVFADGFYQRWTMSRLGDIAFQATAGSASGGVGYIEGIWVERAGQALELALPESAWAEAGSFLSPDNLVINDVGQMSFELVPPPVRGGPSLGGELWFFDPAQGARLVAATDDLLTLTIGGEVVEKTLLTIDVGGVHGRYLPADHYLSESGEILFRATFTDGSSALLVWTPVPEPSAAMLLGVVFLAGVATKRRARP